MSLDIDRVRAELDRRDRRDAKALRDHGGRGLPVVERYIRHRRKEKRAQREPILDSAVFGRVLAALPDGDASVATVVDIVKLIVWMLDAREARLLDTPPAEALQGRPPLEHQRIATMLKRLYGEVNNLGGVFGAELAALTRAIEHPVEHRWAKSLEGRTARAIGAAAANAASAWRGVLVRELNAKVPDLANRGAAIRDLAQLAGDTAIKRDHVASILEQDSRPRS